MANSTTKIFGLLQLTNVSSSVWQAVVTDEQQIIGRSSLAQIVVPREFSSVSRNHAKVWGDNHGCWIVDIGSTFGIQINGIKLAPEQECRMEWHDRIRLGAAEMQLFRPEEIKMEDAISARKKPDSNSATQTFLIPDRKTEPPEISICDLTHAELRVVLYLRRGIVTLKELAATLHCSPNTIRKHLENIYKKMNVSSRHELIAKLLIEPE